MIKTKKEILQLIFYKAESALANINEAGNHIRYLCDFIADHSRNDDDFKNDFEDIENFIYRCKESISTSALWARESRVMLMGVEKTYE